MERHDGLSIYQHPEMYDSAFSYRNVPGEVDAILFWRAESEPAGTARVLELAAGPARHAIEFATRGFRATALDSSLAMCKFASHRATTAGVPLAVVQADFVRFALSRRFAIITSLLDSASHILTLDAMLSHLSSVADCLEAGGIYVMELSHPADFLKAEERAKSSWPFTMGGERHLMEWGTKTDPLDSTTQVALATVRVTDSRGQVRLSSRVPLRRWTALEIEAAARLSGRLTLRSRWGAFERGAVFDDSQASWRMILVFTA